jgi:PAS domain S-box-containing protein
MADMLGYSIDEMQGLPVFAFMNQEWSTLVRNQIGSRRRGNTEVFKRDFEFNRKDGSRLHTLVSASPFWDAAGNYAGATIAVMDITERKKAEEELRLHREITTRMSEGILLVRADNQCIVYANPKAEEMFGAGPGRLIGANIREFRNPGMDAPGTAVDQIVAALRESGNWQGEVANFKRDGTLFWCRTNISAFEHPAFGPVFLSVHTDITERKQAEEALRRNEALLNQAERLAGIGNVSLDIPAGKTSRSDGFLKLFGVSREEMPDDHEAFLGIVHEEDRDRIRKSLNESVEKGVPFQADYRIVRPDKTLRWIHAEGETANDEQGRPVRFFAWHQDITERRKAEEELRRSAAMLAEAERLAGIGSVASDLQTGEVYRSEGIHRIFGADKNEMPDIPASFLRYVHEDDRARLRDALRRNNESGGPLVEEYRICRPDGLLRIIPAEGATSKDAQGRPVRFFAWLQVITERKISEEELRRSEATLTEAQRLAGIGNSVHDLRTGRTYRSDGMLRIFGVSRQEMTDQSEAFLRYVDEEDRHRVKETLHRCAKNQSSFNEDYRIHRPDGVQRIIHSEGEVSKDEQGRPLRIFVWVQDITERRKLEEKVLSISDRERLNIGHDLHDDLGQQLTGVALLGRALQERLAAQSSPETDAMAQLLQHVDRALLHVRELARGLESAPARPEGLLEALSGLASHANSTSQAFCRFEGDRHVMVQDPNVANHLYRIAQEAVHNAVRHGRPRNVAITLTADSRGLKLAVADDGTGFLESSQKDAGMGLDIMRHRASLIHGTLTIASQTGKGSEVICRIPAAPAPRGDA